MSVDVYTHVIYVLTAICPLTGQEFRSREIPRASALADVADYVAKEIPGAILSAQWTRPHERDRWREASIPGARQDREDARGNVGYKTFDPSKIITLRAREFAAAK